MWIPGHAQVGWHLAERAGLDRRDRIVCALAGAAPDVDGLTVLFGLSNYWGLHHTFGHSLVTLPVIAIVIGLCGSDKPRTVAWSLAAAFAHVAVDSFGAMPVRVLWPLNSEWAPVDHANPFVVFPVEFVTPFLMIWWSLAVYRRRGISVLEIFGRRIEASLHVWLARAHAGSVQEDEPKEGIS